MAKYLDSTGLTYLWAKIKAWVQSYASIANGKITIGSNEITPLTSFTETDPTVPSWAKQTNKPSYTASEVGAVPTSRTVNGKALSSNVTLKTSDLTNDSGFITISDVPEGAAASSTTPLMDGVASAGSETAFARGDHKHPSDTAKADKATTLSGYGITDAKIVNGVITLGSNSITPLTSFTESDPTVPSWAKASSKPSYTASEVGAVATTAVGAASGVCPLNASSKIDSTYLPGGWDDVIEAYARTGQTALSQNWLATGSASGTVITPEAGVIYILMADSGNYAANTQFRWGSSTYVKIADGGVSAITTAEIDAIVAN